MFEVEQLYELQKFGMTKDEAYALTLHNAKIRAEHTGLTEEEIHEAFIELEVELFALNLRGRL